MRIDDLCKMNNEAVSVSELTHAIKGLLEEGIGDVIVSGEISNYKAHSSGHRYFTLKDADAQISAVMWRTRALNFRPEDGMHVLVRAKLSVYPPQGKYQLDVAAMKQAGRGDLYQAFERLKETLRVRGYFDEANKQPLPARPASVGIATSATGAALQDMLSTINLRYPLIDVVFRPTLVQGDGSAEDIAKAIAELDAANLDVIVIGRGGGSIEDLWSFNTEIVAEAIHAARTPIISAVGHETDITISDFVADRRAETPTAAAVLVTPVTRAQLIMELNEVRWRLSDAITATVRRLREIAARFLDGRAARRIDERVRLRMQRIDDVTARFSRALRLHITSIQRSIEHQSDLLRGHHPYTPLRKGYAVIERKGAILGASDALSPGDVIVLRRSADESTATIDSVTPTTSIE